MSDLAVATISIYEKIEQKGNADASEIYRIGQEKAKQLEESMISEAQAEIDKKLEKAKNAEANRVKTKNAAFEQNAKQQILLKKKDLIDRSFELALGKLNSLADQELSLLVSGLLNRETIRGDEIIRVSVNDFLRYRKLFSSGKIDNGYYVLDKLNDLLKKDCQLKLSDNPADIDGGFLIIGSDFDIDLSFRTLLEDLKEKNEIFIAKLLFENEA
jgi:V/A-type H+-transporting ATPase subunit E